MQKDLAEI